MGLLLLPAILLALMISAVEAYYSDFPKPNIARDCQGAESENILLQKDHWYSYEAHILGRTAAVGATDQDAQLDLRCSLKVQHSQDCAFTLEFETCSIKSSSGNEENRKAWLDENNWTQFSEHPIAFMVNGGEVRRVLAHPDDPESVVNIKRGVISALIIGNQPPPKKGAGPTHKLHRDVQGLCSLKISESENGAVRTTKDQSGCKIPSKPQVQNSPFSVFWDMSFMQYLVNSTLECEAKLDGNKVLRKLQCSERHAGLIDSYHDTQFGLMTSIGYEFILQESGTSKSSRGLQVDQLRQTGIEYEHEKPKGGDLGTEKQMAEAKDLFEKLLDETEIDLESIPIFQALVQQMRSLTDLKELTQTAEKCSGDQKDCARRQKGIPLYLDALVQCNRLPCLREFRNLQSAQLVKKDFLELAMFSWLRMPITDHLYFNEFLEICRSSQTRFCWLALGGLVRTYSHDHHEIPQSVRDVISSVTQTLGDSCSLKKVTFPSTTPNDQKTNYIVTMLKTLRNMGKVVLELEPSLGSRILACAKNTELAIPARITALQTLDGISTNLSPEVLQELLLVMTDHTLPVEIRIAAYVALVEIKHRNPELSVILASILKDDPSKQVRTYIASDLKELLSHDKGHSTSFWSTLKKELSSHNLTLSKLADSHRHTTSHVTIRERSWELPFLPKELRDFGHRLMTRTVFGDLSAIPQSITTNLNLTLFGQVMDFMEVGLQMSGLDGVAVRSSAILSNMKNSNSMQYIALLLQQLGPARKAGASNKKKEASPVLLNSKWEESAEKIYQAYQNSHTHEVTPHLMLYLRMLGLDLDFTSLPDITGNIQHALHQIAQSRRQQGQATAGAIIPFSRTHIINFVEAEYVFPTLIGAPLKWRSNASCAVSLDTKLDVNKKILLGKLHLKPRLAATMINQMVLEIPGMTEMGFQANNSIFSATEWNLEASAGSDGSFSFKMQPPKIKQRPLELYRTNFILRGGEASELQDWDSERVENKECLDEKFLKATGMSVCIESSYLDVKHRNDKPYYYLAGKASWAISAEMADKSVENYVLNVAPTMTKEQVAVEITGFAKGTELRREVPLKVSLNKVTGEFELDLKHSDFPDFLFQVIRSRIIEGDKHVGFKSSILIKDEGRTWDTTYTKSEKTEIREEKPMIRNESPREKNLEAHLVERQLQIKTPENDYLFKLKLHKQPDTGNLKIDAQLSSTNLDKNHNWLKHILPEVFWEASGHKAWLEFRGDWKFGDSKTAVHKGPIGQHRQSKSHLSIPATVIEVLTHHMHKAKHSMYCYNISKVERATGNKLFFANFTYNVWHKGAHGDPVNDIRTANFTIAQHSWNVDFKSQGNFYTAAEGEITDTFVLSGEKMIPLDHKKDSKYIGWWEPESASLFSSQRWKVTYKHHLRRKPVKESDLPLDSLNEIKDDLTSEENDGHSSEEAEMAPSVRRARNEVIHADVYLEYPYAKKQENLTFTGSFQWNEKKAPVYKIFLKTFTVGSTLHSLQLDSQTVYTKVGNEKKVLSHQSSITDLQTQRNHGIYKLLYRKELLKDSCWEVNLNHSISAHWLNFASHIVGTCKPGKPKARLYNIHIHSDKPYWKELNYNLDQTFDLDQPGGESMNLTSDTMDLQITGSWDQDFYHKVAQFNSKTDVMPSTIWTVDSNKKGQSTLSISAPGQDLEKFTFSRNLNEFDDHLEYNITHVDKASPDVTHNDFHMSACLMDEDTLKLVGGWRPELGSHLGVWLLGFAHNVTARIESKLSDPKHEFNTNMAEYLKGQTISQYLRMLGKRAMRSLMIQLVEIKEIMETFESLYGPSFQIVANSLYEGHHLFSNAKDSFLGNNIGWAFDYFDVNKYFPYTMKSKPIVGDPTSEQVFSYDVKHNFKWTKFHELPALKIKSHSLLHYLSYEKSPFAVPARIPHGRIALVYGPNHILTFDGRPISFPDYPIESCTILLSQDVRGKSFSAMMNEENLFLVFPEMAVTIHSSGRLYINTSKEESITPVSSANKKVVVSRLGEIIRVQSLYLRVDCDTGNEFCIFALDPLLSGGVIGILGNADGERNNDFIGPQNNRVNQISELASIYELSGEQACQNFVEKSAPPTEDPQANKRCDRLLKQESVVKCLNSAGLTEADLRGSCTSDFLREGCPCATSKALAAFCTYDGHKLDRCQFLPRPQKAVPVPNQHDTWLLKAVHQLQVVLVVEANGAILGGGSSTAINGLETLFENLEETFISNGGYSSITYSLVAYGGEGEPHMHTQHRSPWMLQRDLLKSVRDMHFHGSKRGDPVAALEFAATMLPFEATATKIVILITLDDNFQDTKASTKHLHDVQHLFTRNGAVLYVVASYPWLERGKKIFGLRADGLIFPSTGEESYADYPHSLAAKIAAGTRGSIFWRSFLENNNNPYFFESMTEEMLARVKKEAGRCKQCGCAMSPWWLPRHHCKPAPEHLQNC